MKGANAVINTLVDSGVDVCFSNPGTSEMHFVAALDDVPAMRGILALFEGVATGAADGYARIAGGPAGVLLHLGPGLGNGLANLHNARRARTPVVTIVGDHATYHAKYDAPLQSDIAAIASGVSGWVHSSTDPATVGDDVAAAVAAAIGPPGQVATLILPADVTWLDGAETVARHPIPQPSAVADSAIAEIAAVLRSGEPAALLVGGSAMRAEPLADAGRIIATTGAKLLSEVFPACVERGAGVVAAERLGYLAEFAQAQLDGLSHLILVDAASPVSFFAYPDKASDLVPEGCSVHTLAAPGSDVVSALAALAEAVGAGDAEAPVAAAFRPDRPTGELDAETIAAAIGATLPEGAIVSDEANTSGLWIPGMTAGAPRHDWMTLTGGAIGYGMPVATGAAVAAPDRPVLSLEADGSAMYTLQALWTQAREGLNVTTVIFNNRSYAILNLELSRTGAGEPGPQALDMLDLHRPDIDFVRLSEGLGVPARKATSAEGLTEALERSLSEEGPSLIEVELPTAF